MNQVIENIKGKLVEDLKKIFKDKLDKVIIYGSYARGNEDNESDIDVMVLVNEKDEVLRKFEKTIDELSVTYDLTYIIVLSITLRSSSRFHQYENTMPLFSNIVKEGIEIYG